MSSRFDGDHTRLVAQEVFPPILYVVTGSKVQVLDHPVRERLAFHLRDKCHKILQAVWNLIWEH